MGKYVFVHDLSHFCVQYSTCFNSWSSKLWLNLGRKHVMSMHMDRFIIDDSIATGVEIVMGQSIKKCKWGGSTLFYNPSSPKEVNLS